MRRAEQTGRSHAKGEDDDGGTDVDDDEGDTLSRR
jgi:hypothetical protein